MEKSKDLSPEWSWDVERIRADFPILNQEVKGCPLAYLDNAATTQKPNSVIEAIRSYYLRDNANVHRGVHELSVRATAAYEAARDKVAHYIGAKEVRECIFVRGTTEAINLVAQSYLSDKLQSGDEVLITHLEHHSNIVPWQLVCERRGAKLVVAPITEQGEVDWPAFLEKLNSRTKMVAMTYVSNALGTVNPVKEMIQAAHAVGAKVLIDGAQAMPHLKIDVQALGCDFFAFSGHKMFGPTGIGVLWGKAELLESMTVYQGGGEMIRSVSFEHTEFAPIPAKFEAGTPNIAGAIGLAAAIDYLNGLNWVALEAYEASLLAYATEGLRSLGSFRIIGEAKIKVPVVSFVHPHIHAHDVGTILDDNGVAIRSGHHCAMPLMSYYKVPAMSRISMAFYNTKDEIDQCLLALAKVKAVFE
jgi:cysteine desulfurase / selenocysteine lyase